ncbi:MAG: hypothetical protein ACSHWW_13585 [Nonlabens sp.]|uniref:hypothetical protein n=1 Tax=Nonlabens sp. TaxID=1888209 RepID=UPI003EF453FB
MKLKENLKEQYIAFLDVLGFKELVNKRNTESLEIYFNSVRDSLNIIGNEKRNIKSLLISDSTILISPDTKKDFKTLLRAVQTIQSTLAQKGIWLRGAISYGEVYFDENSNLVVGKGLVKAYLLESEAIYPRVIIDPSLVLKIAEDRTEFISFLNPRKPKTLEARKNTLVVEDEDSFSVSFASRVVYDSIENRNLHLIYNRIKKNLYSDPKHYSKYLWVKNHFSDTLEGFEYTANHIANMGAEPIKFNESQALYVEKWFAKFWQM